MWSASAISELGSKVSLLALPFVAIETLDASTSQVAALGVAEATPLVVLSLPAGVWMDRLARRPFMIAADAGRAAVLASVPTAYGTGVLTIWQLYAVALAGGSLTVIFDVASQSFLPSLLERGQLADGNASMQVAKQGAQLTGPGAAGVLVGLLGAPYAIVVDALSYVGSGVLISRIKRPELHRGPSSAWRRMRTEILEGLRYVIHHPILRPNLVFMATANVFNGIFLAVLLLFCVRGLALSAGQIGLILALANAGSLAGATLATRLQRRFGIGRVMLLTAFSPLGLLLIPFAHGSERIPFLTTGLFLWGVGIVIYGASSVSIIQATTPERLLARSNATRSLINRGVLPVGMLLGGVFGTYVGLRTTILIGITGRVLAGLILLASPVRSIRTLDDADQLVREHNRKTTRQLPSEVETPTSTLS